MKHNTDYHLPASMRWIKGGVTAAEGFVANGVSAGIKLSRKPDLALVLAEKPVTAAGIFTKNRVQAAPVLISKQRLRLGQSRAVLINSGCANCLTGSVGFKDAKALGAALAESLKIPEGEILLASTGVIGRRLPVSRIIRHISQLIETASDTHHTQAAEAILTTDLKPKEVALEVKIGKQRFRIGGMAKGSGMIAPSLATMLCVITTDADAEAGYLRALLRRFCESTFNRITVDGDMSTNDTVFALASGRSGVSTRNATMHKHFAQALRTVMERLAVLLVEDGEGASRLMEVRVTGAKNSRQALACARQVANSPLVKTMLASGDPNVGRIAAAAGASGASFDIEDLKITIGPAVVVKRGAVCRFDRAAVREIMRQASVTIGVHFAAGRFEESVLSCDLSEEYVRINGSYRS
ncbi:MAG: bifunctional glutamate N-acetyltransferase/amino-acid acetyltransferase ArgJ [Candidatus Omnitrophica bacterium]|nr:bifunctional glutamate N-acetyltransferase/amino-acid acetyltransferase ArgJ [Candidatus Omnitrophota bacterium]